MEPIEVARFWSKVRVAPSVSSCWLWRGAISDTGYGNFAVDGTWVGSHRIAYTLCRGEIPEGLDLDHLCRLRACCNPWHLEPVTRQENLRRGLHPAMVASVTGICKRGHVIDGVRASGKRYCKTCNRDAQRRRRSVAIGNA